MDRFNRDRLLELATSYFDRPSFSAPSFRDAGSIAFLDDRSGTKQASVLSLSDSQIAPLTTYTERLLSLKGSPESGRVFFGMDVDGNERQQIWVIETDSGEPRRLTHDDQAIHDPGAIRKDGGYVLYRSNARDTSTFDIVGLDVESGQQDIWLEAGGQVSPTDLTSDGEKALVVTFMGNLNSDILLVTREGEPRNLTSHEGDLHIAGAKFTGDGTGVYLLADKDREFLALFRLDIESGEWTLIREEPWDIDQFSVSPNGDVIAIEINDNGRSVVELIDASSGETITPVNVPTGVVDQFSWSPDSGSVAFGFSTVESPSAIMLATLDGGLRTVAEAAVEKPATWSPTPISYSSFDGREIPAFWFVPDGDGPFPVLVDIHGGPESQRRLNYSPSGPVLQYLASLGIAVLSLNVRGSTGYGKTYTHLDDKAKRLDSVKDAAYAVEWLKEQENVDPDRIAVYGRSYGGFMTLASLVFHPDLWAVGIDVVGIANFVSFLERTGAWRRSHREAEYGELLHDRDMLMEISPLTHIDNIRVPLFVCHGRNDPRVPLFEAEQVVEAVRKKGLEVEFKVFDDEGHALSKRKNEIDAFVSIGQFLAGPLRLQ